MASEIATWLAHLQGFQQIWQNIAPGFLEGDLKAFGHQKLSDLLPAENFSSDEISERMEAIGALCQRDGIGIPTKAALQDLSQTSIGFINRVSNVSILPALVRLFRNIGIEADPNLAKFGESSVAGMVVDEVLGSDDFASNQFKQRIHGVVIGEFGSGGYKVKAADLEEQLDSTMKILEIVKGIAD